MRPPSKALIVTRIKAARLKLKRGNKFEPTTKAKEYRTDPHKGHGHKGKS